MKTIGLLGGMSWESTAHYYQRINQYTKETLGGLHSAKIILYSLDFDPIAKLQQQNDWQAMTHILLDAADTLQTAGADCLAICTNTMHKISPAISDRIQIPLLHIADATGTALVNERISKVGLLGTAFTMEESFYKDRLKMHFGLDVITPNPEERQQVHQIIYDELCLGVIKECSKAKYLHIISSLKNAGAEAVILGCTEIGMLVKQPETPIKLFDTTEIHAKKIAQFATEN